MKECKKVIKVPPQVGALLIACIRYTDRSGLDGLARGVFDEVFERFTRALVAFFKLSESANSVTFK